LTQTKELDTEIKIRKYLKNRWDSDPVRHYIIDKNEPLLFYGGPFSNFVGDHMMIEHPWTGIEARYETVEHWFQANKANNPAEHEEVRMAFTPGKAKEIGQRVSIWSNWDSIKYDVMLRGLRHKFDSDRWRKVLLSTGDRYIAEDSPTDAIWGIYNPELDDFSGMNLLGLALMQLRDELRGIV